MQSKSNEIILIYPFYDISGDSSGALSPPLGLMYIASFLERDRHSAGIVDARPRRLGIAGTVRAVREKSARPLLIGLYINTLNQKVCKALVSALRQSFPGSVIAAGGPVPTSIPDRVFNDIAVDYVVRGEGEFAVRDMVRQLKGGAGGVVSNIAGVVHRSRVAPVTARTERVVNLDGLPYPAYHLLGDIKMYSSGGRGRPFAAMIASRGCQYDCDFCSKDVFGQAVTRRSIANILAEIDELIHRYRVKQIDFVDDNLAHSRMFFEQLLDGLFERRYKIWFNLISGIRAEILDRELLKKMRRANFYSLAFGIENADQDVLNMHSKRMDIKLMEEKIALARAAGFFVRGFFIIGLPGETEPSFQKTLDFVKRTRIDMASFCIAVPFPGTAMFEDVKRNGRLLVDVEAGIEQGFYGSRPFFSYPGLDPQDVARRYRTAYREFFTVKRALRLFVHFRGSRWFRRNVVSVVKNIVKSGLKRQDG